MAICRLLAIFIVAFTIALSSSAATAAETAPLTIKINNVPSAPVTITGAWYDVDHPGGYTWHHPGILTCFSFKNVGDKPAVAVQFREIVLDAFDAPIGTFLDQRTGQFTTGALIEGPRTLNDWHATGSSNCYTYANLWPALSTIAVSVSAVRFSDGSIWRADAAPSPSPSSSP